MTRLVGLVGKANVGKSTFFAAATMKPVEIAGFPFTTIKANRGVAYVRTQCVCQELGVKDQPVNSACIDGIRLIPVEIVDCPGLIRGAHQGKGLGNQFLDEVRRADALIILCDAAGSTDENGQPVASGSYDPVDDIQMFESEFTLWLLGIIKKDWDKIVRVAEAAREDVGKHLEEKVTGLGISRTHISIALEKAGLDPYKVRGWSSEDLTRFISELKKASKPFIIAANKADKDPAEENIGRLKKLGYNVIPTCAEAELALRRASASGIVRYTPGDADFEIITPNLSEAQRKALEFIRERVFKRWGGTGIQNAINAAFFQLLETISVYPVEDADKLTDHWGRVLPDCYLIPKGTTVKQFAGLIHSDLAEGFIYAVDAKMKRKLGEDYVLKNNDVVQIVSAKGRK
ncbi:MAG: redox-regulated ATPase YchF [Candidatus Bathyarchaeia archaeon]